MISRDNADIYFDASSHVNAAVWGAYTESQRTAAVATARRVLARALRREMDDDEVAYVEGDTERDEYAVYEQALHMLVNGRITDADSGSPYPIAVKPSEELKRSSYYSEEALRWLGWNGASAVRG